MTTRILALPVAIAALLAAGHSRSDDSPKEPAQSDLPPGTLGGLIGGLVRLGETAEPAVPGLLEVAQGDETAAATEQAIRALGDLGPVARERAAPVLSRLLFANGKHAQQRALIGALVGLGAGRAPALETMKDPDVYHQDKGYRLIEGLAVAGTDPAAVPDLRRIAGDKKSPFYSRADGVLRQLGR